MTVALDPLTAGDPLAPAAAAEVGAALLDPAAAPVKSPPPAAAAPFCLLSNIPPKLPSEVAAGALAAAGLTPANVASPVATGPIPTSIVPDGAVVPAAAPVPTANGACAHGIQVSTGTNEADDDPDVAPLVLDDAPVRLPDPEPDDDGAPDEDPEAA